MTNPLAAIVSTLTFLKREQERLTSEGLIDLETTPFPDAPNSQTVPRRWHEAMLTFARAKTFGLIHARLSKAVESFSSKPPG